MNNKSPSPPSSKLKASPAAFVPRSSATDHAGSNTVLGESSSNSNMNPPSRMMLSQSFGGDPSPFLRRSMVLPAPVTGSIQRYASVSSSLSNITYSGYLYKRSNLPHRNPVDSHYFMSGDNNHYYEEEQEQYHQHQQQHLLQYNGNHTATTIYVDPSKVPELPVMPGIFSEANHRNGGGVTLSTTNTTADAITSTTVANQNYYFLTDHHWPDFSSPVADVDSDQNQQQQNISSGQFLTSVGDTQGVVTPSPVNHVAEPPCSEFSSNQQAQQFTTSDASAATAPAVVGNDQNQENKEAKNPFQLGLDAAAAFFRIHLGGDDNKNKHRAKEEQDGKSTQQKQQQQQHQVRRQNVIMDDHLGALETSAPLLSTTIQPKITSSAPIKMVQNTTSSSSCSVVAPTPRRAIPIPSAQPPLLPPPGRKESFQEANHRRHSAPQEMQTPPNSDCGSSELFATSGSLSQPGGLNISPGSSSQKNNCIPQDFYDEKDGHLWRAKYCVLEDGVLYFYRNANDGESVEASNERKRTNSLSTENGELAVNSNAQSFTAEGATVSQPSRVSLTTATSTWSRRRSSAQDLSKSPMVRPTLHHLDSSGASESSGPCMWEKRVFMDCVGGVRTAEQQYGKNSFELVAIDDEDIAQSHMATLVLQAPNQSEMKEWIFQFHRSLASFMRNIMDVFGSTSTSGAFLDIHHPTSILTSHSVHQSPIRLATSIPHSPSDKQLHRLLSISPRFPADHFQVQQPLSHGHGRTSLRRKMQIKRTPSEGASLSSTPDTDSPQHQFAFREPSPSNLRSTPETISPPSQFLIPPPTAGLFTVNSHRMGSQVLQVGEAPPMHDTLELTKPLPQHPQAERSKPSTGKYIPPHLRNKQQSNDAVPKVKYVPPHLRRQQEPATTPPSGANSKTTLSLADRAQFAPATPTRSPETLRSKTPDHLDVVETSTTDFVRGGCADPQLIQGSILDRMYIQKKASRVGKNPSAAFGSYGGGQMDGTESSLRWEIGAVSECGIRESNEDAYLIANDLLTAFESGSFGASSQTSWQPKNTAHALGLFAIFDGHCGNETARFAVERLCHFIHDELLRDFHGSKDCCDTPFNPAVVESILHDAIIKMDDEFCHLCQEDDRDWESGATALVAMLVNENLVIANLGDCRGVLCRLVDDTGLYEQDEQWCKLENLGESIYLSDRPSSTNDHSQKCFWREVTQTHTPALDNERERIEGANGWITTETEIPIGQLRRMDFHDEDVIEILKRCLHHPAGSDIKTISENERSTKECKAAPQRILHISRVCGELAVSRALGDRDFKAAFNSSFIPKNQRDPICFEREQGSDNKLGWQCPLYLPYPDDHSRRFKGDLVSNKPEFQRIKVGESGVSDEFLLLACDGLWDVMDTDDAVRIVRDLLFRKNWTAKKAAARLAELAIHLGSSDNVTVILIRIFPRGAKI